MNEEKSLKEKLAELLKNKQFWLAFIAVLVIVVKTIFPEVPITEDVLSKTFWVLIALIVGIPISEVAFQLVALRKQLKK
ncbi:MAG: hypothetical protein QUS07_07375 [Methanothrix sp.]|nr:hypothetical protein [Methanothrix sp.]